MLIIVLLLLFPITVHAACTGSSPTWTTTVDESSVQSCVTGASVGDTIYLAAGSATWTTGVTVAANKALTIVGAGIDSTNITNSSTSAFNIGAGNTRITGITFVTTAGLNSIIIDGEGWRVDHIKASSATSGLINGVQAKGFRSGVSYGPTGLVDHVQFTNARVLVIGFPDLPANSGSLSSSAFGLGDGNAVYIEDSTFTMTTGIPNLHDCDYSGRYVFRFNTVVGSSVDNHSDQNGYRGCRRWEVYNTTITKDAAYFVPIYIRGGSGVIFNVTMSSGWGEPYISFDNVRTFTSGGAMAYCDGTSAADGNLHVAPASDAGWPCRDQIGWAQDSSTWTSGNPNPSQTPTPAYLWSNTIGGVAATVNIRNSSTAWIQPDRDYYLHTGGVQSSPTSPFDGTTGMGVGLLSNRPTTCTVNAETGLGVGYWATDQGSWNKISSGEQGVLYRCSATNTWTLYYTPYEYPHPLQGYVPSTQRLSPTINLRRVSWEEK